MARFGLAALAASAALLVGAPAAGAATVGNPGAFDATFTGGQLSVFAGSASVPITAASPVSVAGTIDENGNITIPAGGLSFPNFHAEPIPGTTVDVQLVSDGASGTLNPTTGAAAITARTHIIATIAGLINDTCRVGTPAAPVELPLTSGTSGAVTGVPYSPSDGSATLVSSFTLGSIDCDNPANDPANNVTVASLAGLANELTLSGRLDPIVKPF